MTALKSGAEKINPYDNRREKSVQVEEMFDSIARAYDFMNAAMSFGLHDRWRAKALDAAAKSLESPNPSQILDIACGTGDVTFDLCRRYPEAEVFGLDLSDKMLDEARKKSDKIGKFSKRLTFEKGDCLDLRFADDSFDMVTVAYGVRNFSDLSAGLKEMRRVMRPGGTLCIIELSEPENPALLKLYKFYSGRLIPALGRRISRDPRAYTYLPESIAACPQRDEMADLIRQAGFGDCRWKSLTFGVVTFYIAKKN